jgi:site-specific recombinase XerD
MSKTVAASPERRAAMPLHSHAQEFSLYGPNGARKYLNRDERQRVLAVMAELPPERALFALTLAWTGARVSEVLALTASSFQIERGIVAVQTLKRRRHVVREVPIPPTLMAALNQHFGLAQAQQNPMTASQCLWPKHRVTAWRTVKHVMMLSQIIGRAACPRGLRHSFGVGTLQSGVPLNLVQRWLGHARISTTAIYAAACGPEEQAFAAQFWRANDNRAPANLGISPEHHARQRPRSH